ncbi:YjbE family putative metal transport protein [Domibacillus sp. 8LH]|uniref:YjbE family putative metal transport protein n=1 Tax=Domibacillus sp. 8LH TaxID=3073900 RepID=UPI0031811142
MNIPFFIDLLNIIFVNLLLSADNALIIGMAIRELPFSQRKKVLVWTTAGIIMFYVLFSSLAALIMDIPYIKAIGGILLIWVSLKLLIENNSGGSPSVRSAKSMWEAVKIIVIADLIISFDNVLAISAIAKGNSSLIFFGVLISIILLVFGSSFVAKLVSERPILNIVGSAVLVFSAFTTIFEDPLLKFYELQDPFLCLILTLIVVMLGMIWKIEFAAQIKKH